MAAANSAGIHMNPSNAVEIIAASDACLTYTEYSTKCFVAAITIRGHTWHHINAFLLGIKHAA